MAIRQKFGQLSNQDWLALLQRSVKAPFIEGVEFPRFPHSSIQIGYNGAADEEAMLRAYGFWELVENGARLSGRKLGESTRLLDIGCGWGRITRTFARDVAPENIFGIDIDPQAVTLCRCLGVPGQFLLTAPRERLPFEDGFFNVVVALSVMTHLPETVATELVAEMHRVCAPGAIIAFTVEDDFFFSRLETPGIELQGERWRLLSRYKPDVADLRNRYSAGEYIYLTTNEEQVRSSDVYGDALVPRRWIEKEWAKYFRLTAFIPSAPPLYQAAVIGVRE